MRALPSKEKIVARCTSLSAWELPKETSALAPDHVWSNKDMDPVAPEDQTWSVWTWIAYWATETVSLGTWQTGGSILKSGLSYREAIPAVSQLPLLYSSMGNSPSYWTGRTWIIPYIDPHGTEWWHWCKATHPILRHRPVFLWILLWVLLCRVSLHSGYVLAWKRHYQWLSCGYSHDSVNLAILCKYSEPH